MLLASWKKNDKKAITLIVIFSVVVFATVSVLGRVTLTINPGFNVHVFAKANAVINSMVGLLLLCGLIAVKAKRYFLHKRIMLTSMFLSKICLQQMERTQMEELLWLIFFIHIAQLFAR